jgi:anti-anti-sigma factor
VPPDEPAFQLTVSFPDDATAFVTLAGQLDRTTAIELSAQLQPVLARQPQLVIYDIAQVSYIDDAAARTLIYSADRSPGGQRPVLRRPPPIVLRLLEVTGLDTQCVIEP